MSRLFADVIVDISSSALDRTFSYAVPETLSGCISVGSSVTVPFGKGDRDLSGIVVSLQEKSSYAGGLKEISSVRTDSETAMSELVQLADFMRRNYGSTMNKALRTVFPTRKKTAGRTSASVSLSKDREAAGALLEEYLGKNYQAKARVIAALLDDSPQEIMDLEKKAKVPAKTIRSLAGDGGPLLIEEERRNLLPFKEAEKLPPDVLTEEQKRAVSEIREEWAGQNRPCLLFGITGSGKTLVYMELIEEVIRSGKEAIVLIPEIALTYQTVLRFVHRFGKCVSFLHSRLSEGEKYEQFRAARNGDVKIMVGPRSALFTPFPQLGLIVIDEEHESTYRSENVPRYHARETAIFRASMCGAHVVLGSATPSLISYDRCERGLHRLVTLKERYGDSILPDTAAADMREELKEGNRSILSRVLREAIRDRLDKKQQIMLFLNRRGFASFVTCRSCGHVIQCPHCDVSMTQHKDGTLVCHYCGTTMPMVTKCPECGSELIGGLRIGTEQVEAQLAGEFPQACILRMDMDTTKGKEGHLKILRDFAEGSADILLGTQMIVKGHDFPGVTLVGVLMADLSLNEADYRSSEHTFELITQAIGRCGRGKEKGLAIVQTYHPDHYAIVSALHQDFEGFYKEEMEFRRIMEYPPAGAMAAILGSSKDEKLLDTGMGYLKKYIDLIDPHHFLRAIGPAPEAVGKIKDRYRRVIYIRSLDPGRLRSAKDRIEEYLSVNRGFDGLNIQFDFNC